MPQGNRSRAVPEEPVSRPRNAAATRESLVDAARPLFAQHGYEATTVSQVAQAAGFSPNLVTRYFGGKEGLFLAATKVRLNLDATLAGSIDGFGRRLADQMVDRWESQGDADPLLALLRSASSHPAAPEALGEFLEQDATMPLTKALLSWGFSEQQAIDRANAIQSFVVGTVVLAEGNLWPIWSTTSDVQMRIPKWRKR